MLSNTGVLTLGLSNLLWPCDSANADSFGVGAVLLELVPVASIFFAFTNTVGAALWAADLETGNVTSQGTSPELKEKAKKAE